MTKYLYAVVFGALVFGFSSCENAERNFPDYDGGTTAYFAYQNPVRTLILGTDIYNNTLDNEHKCQIWATMGGAYNGRKAVADIVVDPTLCDNLYFTDEGGNAGEPVLPMPTEYYSLASNQIPYNGDLRGYVEVQFTNAFFNDPKAIENTYVIPLVMTKITGIDRILTGTPREGMTPSRTDADNWDVFAKDYVLYCVKYKNPWDANYIRRGLDIITEKDQTKENVRKDFSLVNSDVEHYTENPVNANDEICGITTKNMTQAIFPVSVPSLTTSRPCNLLLSFSNNKCTISTEDEGVTVAGEGEYIVDGTERPEYREYRWGSVNGQEVTKRDILRLSYTVDFGDLQVVTKDTMVIRDRDSNKKEFFKNLYVIK